MEITLVLRNQFLKILNTLKRYQNVHHFKEELTHLVDKETFSLINNVLDCMNELSDIEAEEAFIEGFSLAVSLLLEALSKK